MDYTFKNTVSNKTIYISGINTEILDLQKYVEVLIINWNHCVNCYLFSCEALIAPIYDQSTKLLMRHL